MYVKFDEISTYDHRTLKTRLPVRSALFKQRTGGLVVRWVTTSEYPLLYVFAFFLAPFWMSSTVPYRVHIVFLVTFRSDVSLDWNSKFGKRHGHHSKTFGERNSLSKT
jgi:hypothetical protein